MPTRNDINNWKPEKLSEWATELEADTQFYETQLGQILTHFTGTSWSGKAHDAAADRFTEEHDQGRKLSQEIRDVAAALRAADQRLANEKRLLLGKVSDAENDLESPIPLVVSDKWVVSCTGIGAHLSEDDRKKAIDKVHAHQGLINTAYNSLVNAVSEVGVAITTATQEIRVRGDQLGDGIDAPAAAPADSGVLGGEDGKAVREAIRPDGTVDPAVLDQIASRLPQQALTQSELDTLAAGGEVSTLPASVQDYYREFYQNAGKDGILAMNDHLKSQEQAGNPVAAARRDALANGLMVVSNENIGTGRNPDGTLRSPGGYQQLPEDLRRTISTRVGGPDANSDRYPTSPPETVEAAQTRFLSDSSKLGELFKQSNPGYEPGVEFSRELTRHAAALSSPGGHPDIADLPGGSVKLDTMEPTLRDYLEVSGRNQEAMTQLLTGETEPGSVPLEDGYDPKKIFQPIFHYDWSDSDGEAAPELFNWIGEEAIPKPGVDGQPGVSLEQSQMAGKAASGLAELLTGSGQEGHIGPFEGLMDMPGKDDQSLGQVNPGLTQQLTGAMIPYLDSIALSPGDQTNGFHLGQDRDLQAVRLSTLFNTDPIASGAWNAAIVDRTNAYSAEYAALHGQPSNDRDAFANAAGRLLGYQDQGLRAEAFDRGLNDEAAEKEKTEKMKLGVDIAATVLSGGVGERMPVAGTFIDVAGKLVGDSIKEGDTQIPAAHVSIVQDDLSAQRHYRMIQALASQDPNFFQNTPPGAAGFPPQWVEDGRLKSYEEIVGSTGSEQNPAERARLQSTAEAWLEGSGVDVAGLTASITNQQNNMQPFAMSRDDYVSRVLKG
ncbi:hypothetical protein [Nocardia cyriacigeorgica]|uniref:TPR repeat region-containing protein n=1 Tax=Nocardia cyriacigeorgica TaxID=135487 RepID=UPI0034DAF08F